MAHRVEEGTGGQHHGGGLDLEDLPADVVLAPVTRGCRLVGRLVQAGAGWCRLVAGWLEAGARGCRPVCTGLAAHLMPVTVCPT